MAQEYAWNGAPGRVHANGSTNGTAWCLAIHSPVARWIERSGSANGSERPVTNSRIAKNAICHRQNGPSASRHCSLQFVAGCAPVDAPGLSISMTCGCAMSLVVSGRGLAVNGDHGPADRVQQYWVEHSRRRNDPAIPELHLLLARCALAEEGSVRE